MFLTNTSCGQRHPGTLSWDTSCGQGRPSTPLEDTSCRLRRPSTSSKQVRLKGVLFRYHEPPRKVFVSMSLLGVPHAPCWSHMLTCWKRPLANRVSHAQQAISALFRSLSNYKTQKGPLVTGFPTHTGSHEVAKYSTQQAPNSLSNQP